MDLDSTQHFVSHFIKKLNERKEICSSLNTLKRLIRIAPNRTITYGSKLCSGSASHRVTGKDSRVVKIFKDSILLADKGFLFHVFVFENVPINIRPLFLCSLQFAPRGIKK